MTDHIDPNAKDVIARAWKDEKYRSSLPAEVREKLPPRPDGMSEMSDEQLEAAAGGASPALVAIGAGAFFGGAALEDQWD